MMLESRVESMTAQGESKRVYIPHTAVEHSERQIIIHGDDRVVVGILHCFQPLGTV